MAKQAFCPKCGQRLIGQTTINYKNKSYCLACYNILIEQEKELEKSEESLYNYIKGLFGLTECPSEVISNLEYLIKQGKTLKGIRATIHYYYEIKGNEANADNIMYLSKTIREQYDNARDYWREQNLLRQKNMQVNLDVPARKIVLKETPKSRRKQLNYRMEDL